MWHTIEVLPQRTSAANCRAAEATPETDTASDPLLSILRTQMKGDDVQETSTSQARGHPGHPRPTSVGARGHGRERARVPPSRAPARQAGRDGQARVHHEVPRGLLLPARQRREGLGQGDAWRVGHLRGAERAAPTTPARSPRSRTWSPRASRGSRSRRRARRCPRRSTRRSRQGVKVVLMDNDIPSWKKKS